MLESFTFATFAERLGEAFRAHAGDGPPLALELIEATDLSGGKAPADRRAPFSLVLRGPLTPLLPQQIYRLEHDALGAFDLFIVPIGPDAHGMRYEAVFG
ncbi:MAG TPA: hypothetical protein VII06_33600 [Chloroflexota bacterium]|jgi:hypothetical protein